MQALATVAKNKEISGIITGYNENDGFTGSATTRGTLKIWLLSQAKFNGLKMLELWARLGEFVKYYGPFLPGPVLNVLLANRSLN